MAKGLIDKKVVVKRQECFVAMHLTHVSRIEAPQIMTQEDNVTKATLISIPGHRYLIIARVRSSRVSERLVPTKGELRGRFGR